MCKPTSSDSAAAKPTGLAYGVAVVSLVLGAGLLASCRPKAEGATGAEPATPDVSPGPEEPLEA